MITIADRKADFLKKLFSTRILMQLSTKLYLAFILSAAAAHVPARTLSCGTLAATVATSKAIHRSKELCFSSQDCSRETVAASSFWENSSVPELIKAELTADQEWIGLITEVRLANSTASIVQIARKVGSASCVRDTYLLNNSGSYSLIQSNSLAQLSQEAGYCGKSFVELLDTPNGPLIAVRSGTNFAAYRLDKAFELKPYCEKKRAFSKPQQRNPK